MLLSMVAFLIAFLIQLLFVFKWNYFRYPYEEFQIMAMGAQHSGFSWDSLYSSAPYGGVIFSRWRPGTGRQRIRPVHHRPLPRLGKE